MASGVITLDGLIRAVKEIVSPRQVAKRSPQQDSRQNEQNKGIRDLKEFERFDEEYYWSEDAQSSSKDFPDESLRKMLKEYVDEKKPIFPPSNDEVEESKNSAGDRGMPAEELKKVGEEMVFDESKFDFESQETGPTQPVDLDKFKDTEDDIDCGDLEGDLEGDLDLGAKSESQETGPTQPADLDKFKDTEGDDDFGDMDFGADMELPEGPDPAACQGNGEDQAFGFGGNDDSGIDADDLE